MTDYNEIILVDPAIQGGKPVFKGTRVAVETLFDYLEQSSLNDFLAGFPSVTRKQAHAAIEIASNLITSSKATIVLKAS